MKLSSNIIATLLASLILFSSLIISSNVYAQQPSSMTFTSGEKINFTSNTEMTFKTPYEMTFQSNVTMLFGTNTTIQFIETIVDGWLSQCDWLQIVWPAGYLPPACTWWEVIDPGTGKPLGEFHVDLQDPPFVFHIDQVWPGPIAVPMGEIIWAKMKVHVIDSCEYFEVHWPSGWYPEPCTWWEIIDPETGLKTGYEFHVDWTNESCEFHVDDVWPGPYTPAFPWYEIWARRKIPEIKPCDYFEVEEPPGWYPEPCTWWEVLDLQGAPTGLEFHVDWTNESCEFHVDEIFPDPLVIPWFPPPVSLTAAQKVNITTCDWFVIVDPHGYLPDRCTWWEVLDDAGAPTGWEFHVDNNDDIDMFHIDTVIPGLVTIPPSYTVTVRKKIDSILPCDWFKVDDLALTPLGCSWWEVLDENGAPTGWEFHVDQSVPAEGTFHVDIVYPGPSPLPISHELTAEKKIDDLQECDWFLVIDPPAYVPAPCTWWEITWPRAWAGVRFHVDSNNGVDKFHIDSIDLLPAPPTPLPWNVTAIPYEPPPPPWDMKPPYPDYAPSGMPDFDQRQGGTYPWTDPAGGRWSHCGPVAVAESLWWLDSEFEPNTIPPPAIIDNYPLVQTYGAWDDHDPLNVPWLVEHLAYLMDTDGLRTGIGKLGTNVWDMQAGITHYLSWSGVNPLGDVDGDGNVTNTDALIVEAALGTGPGVPGWDLRADIWPVTTAYPPAADNLIDARDLDLVTANLGRTGSFYEHTVMAPMWDIIVTEVEKCQDVVLLIAPWHWDGFDWYRYEEGAHFVTVAGLNATSWEIVLSDPIRDNAEAGGYGNVPVPHPHPGPEPPYVIHNNATLVSHDAYPVILDECPGGPLTIIDYPGAPGPYPEWKVQIEAAVITSPYAIRDIAVTDLDVCIGATIIHTNYTCCVNVTVTNEGTQAETFTLTLYWNTTNIIASTGVTLASGATKNVTFSWDTTGYLEYANYTLSAYATPVPGEVDTADNTYVDGDVFLVHIGDVDANHFVEIKDILAIALAYGTAPGDPGYDPNLDINCDAFIDIKDILATAINYGWS